MAGTHIAFTPRVVTPLVAMLAALVVIAAIALGFGLRTWTEPQHSPASVVVHDASTPPSFCKVGRPC
jgi:hypothetical protein